MEERAVVIVVDSAVWADYFAGASNRHVDRLERALVEREDIAILPIIVTEVLQGFRSDRAFRKARDVLVSLPALELSLDCYVDAARLYRRLRRRGVTVRGAVDCVIAQTCMEIDAELLSPDTDFAKIAGHSRLRLCLEPSRSKSGK